MASTKRKRRSKHRGNAAGIVEARGRTGRKLTVDERKQMGGKLTRVEKSEERMLRPPTWQGAATRAAFAAIIFGVVIVALFGQEIREALMLVSFVFLLYIPLGYYTDQLLYKRRLKKKGLG